MENEVLLAVIERLNEQVAQLNLENVVLRTKLDLLQQSEECEKEE